MVELSEIVSGLEKTQLLYWSDPYLKVSQARTLRVEPDEKHDVYVVLDKTIFHPKSGGQPSDKGFITGSGFKVEVKKAMLANGVVVHWGRILEGEPKSDGVEAEIDWRWRYLVMRRHTAGHLYDHCLTQVTGKRVETTDSWLGDPCYVGYRGRKPSTEELGRAERLENQAIGRGAVVKSEIVSYEELLERAAEAPNIYRLPKLESFRIVTIEGCDPIPCGGTHLRNVNEVGHFKLKDVIEAGDGFRVYYEVEDL